MVLMNIFKWFSKQIETPRIENPEPWPRPTADITNTPVFYVISESLIEHLHLNRRLSILVGDNPEACIVYKYYIDMSTPQYYVVFGTRCPIKGMKLTHIYNDIIKFASR